MAIKIEKIMVERPPEQCGGMSAFEEFAQAVKFLDVGESFVCRVSSNHHQAVRLAQIFLDREYLIRKLPASPDYRVGRIR